VILWDWPRRRQVQVLSGHISTVTSAAFSPDSRTLATAGNDRRIKLWQPASGQLIHTMTGSTGYVRDIAFADNNRLISVGDSGNLRVWHVTLGQLLCSLQPDRGSIQVKAHDGCLAKWNFS
jgi:WD40 repeat protein